ncbi:flagellar biosynthesis protein FlhA [Endozoicomonadaceae bacterium StTr2]
MKANSLQQILPATRANAATPVMLLALLGMIVLQLPPLLLDILFTFNIAVSLIVLLVAIYTLRPLEFRVFPTILLVATLTRLALNVASTRVVLLQGHEGGAAAGKVIEAFGNVVIGGNYVVGIVVFAILVLINFVVITKGGGRISEVTARFTLDAMPGKQMAIDADLNAGLIDQEQARTRREEVRQEADFYGAMDGASKFVRGDAVAGLLILAINLIGGTIIGATQHGLSIGQAFETYSLLTIGDGLVAQIPSLLLSTTAAIMVTRVSDSQAMGEQVANQMMSSRALAVTSGVLIVMGLVPGMPHLAFLSLGSLVGYIAWTVAKREQKPETKTTKDKTSEAGQAEQTALKKKELSWEDIPVVDSLGLELGYRLVSLVNQERGGDLLERIKGVRKNLSTRLGFLLPTVHVRDNLKLDAVAYRVNLMGIAISEGEIYPEKLLALNPGQVFGKLEGVQGTDPAYGLPATWITQDTRDHAVALGYTVVDPATVIATHIGKIMEEHAHELIGYEETRQIVDQLARLSPKMADELVPGKLSVTALQGVFQQLLLDGVPLTDVRTIAGTLMDATSRHTNPVLLAQDVRVALRRTIIDNLVGMMTQIPVITLSQNLEQLLLQAWEKAQQTGQFAPDAVPLEPNVTQQLQHSMPDATQQMLNSGKQAILLVAPQLRPLLARFARLCSPEMAVLSYTEIPDNRQVNVEMNLG